MAANCNKFSISADISTEGGAKRVHKIAGKADILIENYKTGGLKKYGLDHETCVPHILTHLLLYIWLWSNRTASQ